VATQQQVYGRLALEHVGPGFEASKTGGLQTETVDSDRVGRTA
jgi:NADH dehydrogenase